MKTTEIAIENLGNFKETQVLDVVDVEQGAGKGWFFNLNLLD